MTKRTVAGFDFLRSSSLYAVLSLGWLIAYGVDLLVVTSILDAEAAAVFAVAVRMFNVVGVTLNSGGQQMWPALADAVARGDLGWARSRFRRSVLIVAIVATTASAGLVVFGRALAELWVGASLVPPLSLLIVLAIWMAQFSTTNQATYLLTAVGNVRMLALTGLLMAPLNLALSIVFVRIWGLPGPILGSIVALLVVQTVPVIVYTRSQLLQPQAPAIGGHVPGG